MATNANQQQHRRQEQQQQQNHKLALEELAVAKVELTSGDTTGLVYVRSSPGSAFLVESRSEALRIVERKMEMLEGRRSK